MRRVAAAVAVVVIGVGATGCLGRGNSAPSSTCEHTKRPTVAMAVRLALPPTKQAADCLARSHAAVFGSAKWGDRPKEMLAVNPTLQLWQARSLMYACDGCPQAVFSRTWIEHNRPEWILHTAAGGEVHPVGKPDQILLNFANLNYQTAWAEQVAGDLGHEGWTGVNVIDADNDPDWDAVPVNPAGKPITPQLQRNYLGHALEVTRAVIKTSGYRLAAQNGPPSIIDSGQINSTDSVSVGRGFAQLTGRPWTQLFDYFHVAFGFRAAPVVWDDHTAMTRSERIYGLASYLLIQTALSVYGARSPLNPLYRIDLGDKDDGEPVQQGAAWTRQYPSGSVAVNPSALSATVSLSGQPPLALPPFSAVILAGSRTVRSW